MLDLVTPPGSRSSYITASPVHRPSVWPLPRLSCSPSIIRSDADSVEIGYDADVSSHRFVPVFAVHDGVISFAAKSSTGYTVSLDHVGGWSTHYGHLEHMFTLSTDRFRGRRKERVRAGDIIGYSGRDPVRIAFEIWRSIDDGHVPVDPTDHLRDSVVLPWSDPTDAQQPAIKIAA